MRKIFLIPLMTLMCSVMAWAVDVATWDELMAAVANPNASVTLTANISIPAGTHDLNGATVAYANKYLQIPSSATNQVTVIQNASFTGTGFALMVNNNGGSTSLENIQITNNSQVANPNAASHVNSAIRIYNAGTGNNSVILNLDANCSLQAQIGVYSVAKYTTINNRGSINASAYGIDYVVGQRFTLNNYSTASIVGGSIGVYTVNTDAKKVTIVNDGTISGGTSAGINIAYSPDNTITNNGTIETTGQGNTNGIYVNNKPLQLVNNGTIRSNNGVNVQYSSNAATTSITNNGTIIGHGSGLYVIVDDYQATITNNSDAIIRSTGYTNSFGVSATKANIINYGQIYCTDNSMNNTAFGVGISNSNVTNEGTINRLKVYGGVNNPITNSGAITEGVLVASSCKAAIENASDATLGQTLGSAGEFELTNAGTATFAGGTFNSAVSIENNGTASITAGTYNGVVTFSGSNIVDIYAGDGLTFAQEPVGSNALIHPYCVFTAGVGDLSIEEGYIWRASDGTIVEEPDWVAQVNHEGNIQKYAWVEEAFAAAEDGDVISLIKDATSTSTIWIGTESIDGTPKSLTFDLNGHTLTSASTVQLTFLLSHGALTIKNSVPGEGEIYNNYTTGTGGEIVRVHGSYLKDCNPRTDTPFSHLTIEEGATLHSNDAASQGVTVFEIYENATYMPINKYTNYLTNVYGGVNSTYGVANGVRVDIKGNINARKYPVKVNGNIRYPEASYNITTFLSNNFPGYVIAESDTAYSPYVHIHPSARIEADNTLESSAAVYASGYARCEVEGTCKGATGLYVRGGKVNIKNDANIQSSFGGSATFTPGKTTSGIATKGNAIVVNPNSTYSGHIVFNVEGDARISTGATGGAALLEDVKTASLIESIAINGGQFTGPYALAICEATQASGAVVVYGTTLTSEYVADVSGIMASGVHKVVIPNNDGTTTVIVSKGEVPTSITEFGDTSDPKAGEIVSLLPGSDVNWTGTNAGVIGDGSNSTILSLGELQIISGTEENKQLLTIKENATLEVDRLIMSENARIVVKEGAKLIVKGTQGINAPSTENILLESSEDKQCIFLFNPAVTSNRHPSATYKFASKARYANGICTWQRFGAPTFNGATTMTWEGDVKTALFRYDLTVDNWVQLPMSQGNIYEIEGRPFECYNMTINENPENDVVYTFTGELMGNNDASLKFVRGWNSFANSYAAPIDVKSLVWEINNEFESGVDATVYIYQRNNDGTTGWISINGADVVLSDDDPVINSMQAFILHANNQAEGAVSYERNVYEPIIPSNANQAPARRMRDANAYNGVSLTFTDGVQNEVVKLLEGEEFSDEFDNMYDAVKLENDNNFSAYCIIGEEKYSTVATNDLTDKAIVFDNKVAGTFTLNVNSAVGELLKLYDAVAKQLINLEKGTSYEFEAEAVNDPQRFIVKPSDIPSSIDETEIVLKASKFVGADGQIYILRGGNVYSIQGQQIH